MIESTGSFEDRTVPEEMMLQSLSELFSDEPESQASLFGASLSDFMNNNQLLTKRDVSTMATKWSSSDSMNDLSFLPRGQQKSERSRELSNADHWLASLEPEDSTSTDFSASVSKLLGSFTCLVSQNQPISESERQTLTDELQRLSIIRKTLGGKPKKRTDLTNQLPTSQLMPARTGTFSIPMKYCSKSDSKSQLRKTTKARKACPKPPSSSCRAAADPPLKPARYISPVASASRKIAVKLDIYRQAPYLSLNTSAVEDYGGPPPKPIRQPSVLVEKKGSSRAGLCNDCAVSKCSSTVTPPPPPTDTSPIIPRRFESPRKQVKVVKCFSGDPPTIPVRSSSRPPLSPVKQPTLKVARAPLNGNVSLLYSADMQASSVPPPPPSQGSNDSSPIIPRRYQSPRKQRKKVSCVRTFDLP